jgi:exodeoxyribonuclease V alpha subunit
MSADAAGFAAAATDALAEGFGRALATWARRLGADDAAQRLAATAGAAVSRATSAGHVCLRLDELERSVPGAAAAALRASTVVGTAAEPGTMPLVLDDEGRLYLHRYFAYERRLAQRLVRAARAPARPIDPAATALLRRLFAANASPGHAEVDWQAIAVALALRQRLVVVSGGPGTGKTTTVVNLLACLIAQDPQCRIALAAPTGKAAARMSEAIRQRAAALPTDIAAKLPADAATVHRLLGARPDGGVAHHRGNPLALDALVVDEASMLDLALATRLLDAVPDDARVVLIGDKDQLAAVESGAVFAEIGSGRGLSPACREALAAACGIDPALVPSADPGPIADAVVWFDRNYRFGADSGIGRLAADINAGRAADALAWLGAGTEASLRWLDDAGPQPGAELWRCVAEGYAPYLDAVRRDPQDRGAIAAAFDRFRVLCALRDGARGVDAINQRAARHARELLAGGGAASPWFVGRPVMVLRNDPVNRLFNGDIGIALPGPGGELRVWFADRDGGFRPIAPLQLPAHETAFATTVHKAQGSEFDQVLVVLPQRASPVATRELLYTAVTRAKSRVTLAAGADILRAAIESPTRRHSGLVARLREAAG